MKGKLYTVISIFLAMVLVQPNQIVSATFNSSVSSIIVSDPAHITDTTHNSPIVFIENVGQVDEQTQFQVWGTANPMKLTEDGLQITLLEPVKSKQSDSLYSVENRQKLNADHRQGVNLQLSFIGANPHPRLEPFSRLDTSISYFSSKNSSNWHVNVPVWGGVRYIDLYRGINLEISSENGQIVQRLIAQSEVDLRGVRLRLDGADALTLENDYLHFSTSLGSFALPLLQVVSVDGSPILNLAEQPRLMDNRVSFPFAAKKSAGLDVQSAILNATNASDLLYATLLGGSGWETASKMAVDTNGATYITGWTVSSDFPATAGAFDTTYNNNFDVFVAKLSPDGSSLVYATYLGSSSDDRGNSIAIDASGNAYITGMTQSVDFPITPGAFDTDFNGVIYNAFITKLNETGDALLEIIPI